MTVIKRSWQAFFKIKISLKELINKQRLSNPAPSLVGSVSSAASYWHIFTRCVHATQTDVYCLTQLCIVQLVPDQTNNYPAQVCFLHPKTLWEIHMNNNNVKNLHTQAISLQKKLYVYIQSAYDMCAAFIIFSNDSTKFFSLFHSHTFRFSHLQINHNTMMKKMGNGEQVNKILKIWQHLSYLLVEPLCERCIHKNHKVSGNLILMKQSLFNYYLSN